VKAVASRKFGRLSDKLLPAEYEKLRQSVKKATSIVIVGHSAMWTGNSPGNIAISERRARHIHEYLVARGFRGEASVVGVGALAPMTRVMTESAQSMNRRVRIYIIASE
jgi:outer membrane protein OmpA-like peptidoglycan-associated protein